MRRAPILLLCLGLVRCGGTELDDTEHLPLGEMPDIKADGWGHATECKPIPQVAALADPAITISVGGLTLRLVAGTCRSSPGCPS